MTPVAMTTSPTSMSHFAKKKASIPSVNIGAAMASPRSAKKALLSEAYLSFPPKLAGEMTFHPPQKKTGQKERASGQRRS